ncbi:MAG: sigma-70 family RNA polymerase sigma factor [Actinobacteria bacterium]|nr:sigma-70 family RNA polymerase sigma factor [Actinomycetota bacterium]
MNGSTAILWKNYKSKEDVYYRDKLIKGYRPFLKSIVNHVYSKLPKTVDINDLESYAIIGLLDAIKKFDISRDIKFETYASFRIKGAIIDGMRKQDWLSRSLRDRYKAAEAENTDNGVNEEDFIYADRDKTGTASSFKKDIIAESAKFYMYSIDDPNFYSSKSDDAASQIENIYDIYAVNNTDFAQNLETRLFLKQIILKLSPQERKIVYLYYFKGKNLKEIGKILNITESRVSQINKQILSFLKKEIQKSS